MHLYHRFMLYYGVEYYSRNYPSAYSTSHARATSPTSIQPHLALKLRKERHGRAMTEPSYTSYLGTPRQDVPQHVYTDTAMYEDVFEKKGSFIKNPTHNISCPLSQNYNRCNISLFVSIFLFCSFTCSQPS